MSSLSPMEAAKLDVRTHQQRMSDLAGTINVKIAQFDRHYEAYHIDNGSFESAQLVYAECLPMLVEWHEMNRMLGLLRDRVCVERQKLAAESQTTGATAGTGQAEASPRMPPGLAPRENPSSRQWGSAPTTSGSCGNNGSYLASRATDTATTTAKTAMSSPPSRAMQSSSQRGMPSASSGISGSNRSNTTSGTPVTTSSVQSWTTTLRSLTPTQSGSSTACTSPSVSSAPPVNAAPVNWSPTEDRICDLVDEIDAYLDKFWEERLLANHEQCRVEYEAARLALVRSSRLNPRATEFVSVYAHAYIPQSPVLWALDPEAAEFVPRARSREEVERDERELNEAIGEQWAEDYMEELGLRY